MTTEKSLTFKTGDKARRGVEKMVHGTCLNFSDITYSDGENDYPLVTDSFYCTEKNKFIEKSIYSCGCKKHYAR